MANLMENLEFWMTNLPQQLKRYPIIHLAIPGSHDSMTYAIKRNAQISSDVRPPLQYLKFLSPILSPLLLKWSKTQLFNVSQQLTSGIRYFDLRISTKPNENTFYFVHNLYSEEVDVIFDDMVTFLNSHPQEVIILDCQHFYKFNAKDHKRFINLLFSKFGQKLLPYTQNMEQLNLEYISLQLRCQIILIYRDEFGMNEKFLWPSKSFPTPWPNTLSVSALISFLDEGLKHRNSSYGYVSQCVLTPNVWYVCKNLTGCLQSNCFLPLVEVKYDWLKRQKPGVGGLNIVISDFVHYQDNKFAKEVVGLNYKLLNDRLNH